MKLNKLIVLNGFFIMSLLVSNVTASKIISVGSLVVPAAVVAYAITFLCTDVIGELYGKEEANKTVRLGFILQVFSICLIYLAIKLPPAPFMVEYNEVFQQVLGQSLRVVIASLIAYTISQFNDVYIFHKLKDIHGGKHRWIRNNVSTITSQLIDTSIFITIAFYGVVPNLWALIIGQFTVKVCLALLDTPFFYIFTNKTTK